MSASEGVGSHPFCHEAILSKRRDSGRLAQRIYVTTGSVMPRGPRVSAMLVVSSTPVRLLQVFCFLWVLVSRTCSVGLFSLGNETIQ